MIQLDTVKNELMFADEELRICLAENSERRWRNFVGHLEVAFTKLFEITKGTALQKDVLEAKKRKLTDPLLRYVRESRNTINHTAKDLTGYQDTGREYTREEAGVDFWIEVSNPDGTTEERGRTGPLRAYKFSLVTVLDRNKIAYPPPRFHLGKALKDPTSFIEVGALAIIYYQTLYNTVYLKSQELAKKQKKTP